MNKYDSLIVKIADEYNIEKGKLEPINNWKMRVIYSLLGRMAIAALFDDIEGDMTSITHMKNRIIDVLESYRKIYPEINGFLPEKLGNLADEIYDIYLHTGVFYHIPNRIVPAKKTEDFINNIIFTRGYELNIQQNISGLGTYMRKDNTSYNASYKNIFHLDMTNLEDRWKFWTENVEWTELNVEGDIEYLRLKPPFTGGYWVNKSNGDGRISLLRTGFKENKLYYLYKEDLDANLFVCQLPTWIVKDYNYRSLANACLYYEGVLPPTTYRYDGDIVYVKFGYLPSPSNLYLWKLYSWPTSFYEFPRDFNRICTRYVFEGIVELMKKQGYEFIEEK